MTTKRKRGDEGKWRKKNNTKMKKKEKQKEWDEDEGKRMRRKEENTHKSCLSCSSIALIYVSRSFSHVVPRIHLSSGGGRSKSSHYFIFIVVAERVGVGGYRVVGVQRWGVRREGEGKEDGQERRERGDGSWVRLGRRGRRKRIGKRGKDRRGERRLWGVIRGRGLGCIGVGEEGVGGEGI